jgi:hypothetical protein
MHIMTWKPHEWYKLISFLYIYDICEVNPIFFSENEAQKEPKINEYEPFWSHFRELMLWYHWQMWQYFLIKIPLTNAGTLTYVGSKLEFGCHGNICMATINNFNMAGPLHQSKLQSHSNISIKNAYNDVNVILLIQTH